MSFCRFYQNITEVAMLLHLHLRSQLCESVVYHQLEVVDFPKRQLIASTIKKEGFNGVFEA